VEACAQGICEIHMPGRKFPTRQGDGIRHAQRTKTQLEEYFERRRTVFSLPRCPVVASDFRLLVWAAIDTIPYGQTRTYGEVASEIGHPLAFRAVGTANGHNPWPIITPCHRVVASTGLGGYGGGLELKRSLLELEGITRY
jgi:methylated-DNA-[protein]-cysteine S-methyltransferase